VAKKKKNNEPESTNVQVVRVTPGFTTQFKEDLGWWFKTDAKKASEILDLVSAVMTDPFQEIGKPESLKYDEIERTFIIIFPKNEMSFAERLERESSAFTQCQFV
jgi:hypothetical protein